MNSFDTLLKVLEAILLDKSLTKVYPVVDALDECRPANRDRVFELQYIMLLYPPASSGLYQVAIGPKLNST